MFPTMPIRVARQSAGQGSVANYPGEDFVAAVLGDTEDRWAEILGERNVSYTAPKLVLFSGSTRSACGRAESAMGPFYCPNDERIYLDTEFFDEIQTRLGGCPAGSKTCEFSQAYVIAHEVGHHVQDVLGILPKAEQMQQNVGEAEANQIQVRVELQADCFAGLWANRSQAKLKFLENGDVDAALQTASAIGDDTLQKRARGYAVPELLHPRHLGRAQALVLARPAIGPAFGLRYLLGEPALAVARAPAPGARLVVKSPRAAKVAPWRRRSASPHSAGPKASLACFARWKARGGMFRPSRS